MKTEIKEILDDLKNKDCYINNETILTFDEVKQLLDYITNLQKENQKLKELCDKYEEEHSTAFNLWKMKMEEMPTYEEKEDYKSRIDKAISLLKEAGCYDEETKTFCDDVWEELPELLDILQGEEGPVYECMDCGCWFEEPFEGSCPKCHSGDICKGEDK